MYHNLRNIFGKSFVKDRWINKLSSSIPLPCCTENPQCPRSNSSLQILWKSSAVSITASPDRSRPIGGGNGFDQSAFFQGSSYALLPVSGLPCRRCCVSEKNVFTTPDRAQRDRRGCITQNSVCSFTDCLHTLSFPLSVFRFIHSN